MRVATVNLASGRGGSGSDGSIDRLAAAFAELGADVLCVQELDAAQPRSARIDQPAVWAGAFGAPDWRAAATLFGTPGPQADWVGADPVRLRGPQDAAPTRPEYGIAVFSRRPVRRWHSHSLPAGRARLPIPAADPSTGRSGWHWIPDEPRVAVAAELDGLTVIGTHLSFFPPTAVRQLRAVRSWARSLPGPILLAGDLNLPGSVPALLVGGRGLVDAPSYPAQDPRVQLDHLIALGGHAGREPTARRLPIGDHLALAVTLDPSPIVADR